MQLEIAEERLFELLGRVYAENVILRQQLAQQQEEQEEDAATP